MKLTLPLFSCALAVSLVGCGNNPPPAEAPKPAEKTESAPASALPADAPTVIVATTGTGAPVTYKDEQGNLTGIDVDVVKAVGEKEGFKVEVIQVAWKDIFTGLEEKKYDIAVAGISWTEERNGKYGLSDSYFVNPTSLAYKADATVKPKSLDELENVRVSVLKGSNYEKMLETVKVKQIIPAEKGTEAFKALVRGEADAFLHSNLGLRYRQAHYPDQNLEIHPIEKPDEISAQRVMALNKENTELLAKVNSGIAKLKAEGEIDKITEKHLAIARLNPNPEDK